MNLLDEIRNVIDRHLIVAEIGGYNGRGDLELIEA